MPSVIILPQNENLVEKLRAKLAQYERRLAISQARTNLDSRYRAPEQLMGSDKIDSKYKIAVLQRVLETGSVDTSILRRELLAEEGEMFNETVFDNACCVIKNYCAGTVERNVGGTGLE